MSSNAGILRPSDKREEEGSGDASNSTWSSESSKHTVRSNAKEFSSTSVHTYEDAKVRILKAPKSTVV